MPIYVAEDSKWQWLILISSKQMKTERSNLHFRMPQMSSVTGPFGANLWLSQWTKMATNE